MHPKLTSPQSADAKLQASTLSDEHTDLRMEQNHYIIRGGRAGKERLRVLWRVMRPTTLNVLERAGVRPGMKCLEVGCGSGDLAFELAWIVGPKGKVVATDIDGAQPCADDGKYCRCGSGGKHCFTG